MNTKFLIGVFFCIVFIYPSYSQTYFEKTYGSAFDDEAYCIEVTNDNGYIVTGKTKARAGSDYDIFLLKINAAGDQEWFKVINNPGDDWGRSVRQTSDNGYIVGGEISVVGGLDYTLAKFDASGNLSWQKNYHGKASDRPSYLQITSDGGFLMTGYSETSPAVNVDAFLLKTDNAGVVEWAKSYDGSNNDAMYGFSEVSDGYITTGYTQSYGTGSGAGFINKIDKSGNLLWTKVQSYTSGFSGFFYCSSYNSNFLTIRESDVGGARGRDAWVYKFDAAGNTIWSKAFGTNLYDESFAIAHTSSGEFVVAGFSNTTTNGFNASVFRCDDAGTLLWSKTYGGTGDDRLFDVKTVGNSGHIACGHTASSGSGAKDIYILRIDKDGNAGASCSYSSAGFSSVDHLPTLTNPSPASGDYTVNGSVVLPLAEPVVTTTDLCQTICTVSNSLLSNYDVCNGTSIILDAGNPGYNYVWSTGELTQTILVSTAGNYWVDITQGTCSLRVETDVTEIIINNALLPVYQICNGSSTALDAGNPGYNYLWSTGETTQTVSVSTAGDYWVDVSQGICSVRIDTKLKDFSSIGSIGSDQVVCQGQTISLYAPADNQAYTYLWSNGSNASTITTGESGEYYVLVSLGSCTLQSNTVKLLVRKSDYVFPNLITRNNDGKNDVLQLHADMLGGVMTIVNRWGKTVYEDSFYQNEFDGSGLSDGVYFYHYKNTCEKEFKGWLQVISD